MRRPRRAGSPINSRRLEQWRRRFEGYRQGVTEQKLLDWIGQFVDADQDLAARVLDVVEFVSPAEIDAAFRQLLQRLPGWSPDESQRRGRFAFVAFSSSAGESGDSMLHRFRLANELNSAKHKRLFLARSEIVRERLGAEDTLVFIDDFVGSGRQATTAWGVFEELTFGVGNIYLMTVAAYTVGLEKIRKETSMVPMCHRELKLRDSLFNDSCKHFDHGEKGKLLTYCKKASRSNPRGFGNCGLLIVLAHQCPNNSIAILHNDSDAWMPLFPRG